MMNFSKKRIGEILLEKGFISKRELEQGIALKEKTNKRLGETLVQEGYISEDELYHALEVHTGIPRINLEIFSCYKNASLIPAYLAKRHRIFPLARQDKTIIIAVSDPLDVFALDDVKMITGCDVEVALATNSQIDIGLSRFYKKDAIPQTIIKSIRETRDVYTHLSETKSARRISIARLLDLIIEKAVHKRASDIHIEPQPEGTRIRYRLDGVLVEVANLSLDYKLPIVQRVKVSANLDITKKMLPQDGRMEYTLGDQKVDIRVSTMPTVNGEKVVLRILDNKFSMTIDQLGFTQSQLSLIGEMLKHPFGMVLVTGSVGCGKTTTLYSMIQILNTPEKNIVTLEEPVEYRIPGVNQTQIHLKAGLTYAKGIRSLLRQDPNIIMIGEIRDAETATLAVRAALTGSIVFSSLHTNKAAGTISRLLDMGVESYLLASCLVGVISQTLVRRICTNCKESYPPTREERRFLGLPKKVELLWRGKGCEECSNTGYRGRIAVAETILIDDCFKKLIMRKSTSSEFENLSREKGVESIRSSALKLLERGITSTDEILRRVFYSKQ